MRHPGMEFSGAKLVCLIGGRLLTLLRDDRPDIVFPNHWDMPGGGREGAESPEGSVLREAREEVGLDLAPAALVWRAVFESLTEPGTDALWFAAELPGRAEAKITFGDEGQCWALMAPRDWFAHPRAIAHFKPRGRAALTALRGSQD